MTEECDNPTGGKRRLNELFPNISLCTDPTPGHSNYVCDHLSDCYTQQFELCSCKYNYCYKN